MIRMIGAALVVLSSGAVGFGFARAVKLQCAQLEGLLWALDTMPVSYTHLTLPTICSV